MPSRSRSAKPGRRPSRRKARGKPGAQPATTMRLRVERLGHRGDGVARPVDENGGGEAVYVPCVLPGELVEAEVAAGRGRLLAVVEPAPDRAQPFCPVFGVCGGCASQHMAPATYAAWKRGIVVTALRNRGIETDVRPLVDAHGDGDAGGRRRVTLHTARTADGRIAVGFNRRRDRSVVDLDACPLLSADLADAFELGRAVTACAGGPRAALDLRLTGTDTGLDLDIAGAAEPDLETREGLAAVAETFDLARLSVAGETLAERRRPIVDIGGIGLAPPAGGFLQATRAGEAALRALVLGYVPSPDAGAVADLFSGVGPFALGLARTRPVLAVDSDAAALRALEDAAHRAPNDGAGLKPLDVRRRDLFADPMAASELTDFSAVVFDPPRAGAEAQARELAVSAVPVVIGVSCQPSTFARDAALLIAGGYRLRHVTPVDQFRHAAHVELVGVFAR